MNFAKNPNFFQCPLKREIMYFPRQILRNIKTFIKPNYGKKEFNSGNVLVYIIVLLIQCALLLI